MRACVKCGLLKAENDFRLRKSFNTGQHYRGKICKACHATKARVKHAIWLQNNPNYVKDYNRKYRQEHQEESRDKARRHMYKKKYGITPEEKNWMLVNQDNRCIICNTKYPAHKSGWCVDHDHKTGKIRSILCYSCNLVIGFAKEQSTILRMAAKYLDYHHAQR